MTQFASQVFSKLLAITGNEQTALQLMELNFDMYARRHGYKRPAACAKDIALYGETRKPELIERFFV